MAAQRNPTIPGTKRDRTGSAGILRRANAAIRARFAGLQSDALAIFDAIRTLQVNADEVRTVYLMTPDEMAATSQALQRALDRWISAGRETGHVLWWEPFDAEAAQLGAAQTVANLSGLSTVYAAARSLDAVVYSEPYRNRVSMAQIKSYEHWTGLSSGLRSELSQVIGRAVADGKNTRAARAEIMERLDASKSRAMLYAQTDITDTLRQARAAEAEHASEQLGLKIGLLWTSALIPTTRPTHASRNGRVYTPGEVRAFYDRDGNRFRCHCATTECLLDATGAPILTERLKATMAKERADWALTTLGG